MSIHVEVLTPVDEPCTIHSRNPETKVSNGRFSGWSKPAVVHSKRLTRDGSHRSRGLPPIPAELETRPVGSERSLVTLFLAWPASHRCTPREYIDDRLCATCGYV